MTGDTGGDIAARAATMEVPVLPKPLHPGTLAAILGRAPFPSAVASDS